MIKVLVIGDQYQRIRDQIFLCRGLLKMDKKFRFLFVTDKSNIAFLLRDESNLSYIFIGKYKKASKEAKEKKINSHKIRSKIFNKLPFIYEFLLFFIMLFELYSRYYKVKKAIHEFKPKIILSNGDRHNGLEQVVLKVAKDNNIKVIVPHLVYSTDESCVRLRQNKVFLDKTITPSKLLSKFIMKVMPNQVFNYENNKYLFYRPSITLAYKLFGSLSKNPWYIGNGLSDFVCVDNINSYIRYKNNKVPEEKLKIIGDISFDKVYEKYKTKKTIKNKIIKKYDLDPKKRIIIVSLPQLAEHNLLSWKDHWKETRFLMKSLDKKAQNILVSLHPKMKRDKYEFLENEFNCKILTERMFDVLPIADLFIATFSSTIFWAVLCGINSIVVDFINLDINMFNFLKTVKIITRKEKLESALEKYQNKDLNFKKDWKSLSRNNVFDGKVIERYRKFFLHVI